MKNYLPISFDINKHIEKYSPTEFNIVKFNIDAAKYILSLISTIPMDNNEISNILKINGGYTPLYSNALQEVVHDYRKYLDYFIDTGVIEANKSYASKKIRKNKAISKGYRFVNEFKDKKLIISAYSYDFTKRLIRINRKHFLKINADFKHLIKWIYPEYKLSIDEDTARKYLTIRLQSQLNNPNLLDEEVDPTTGEKIIKDPNKQYDYANYSIDKLVNNDIYCIVDNTVGRMHTNLTNMKSELRNLITYDNQPLVSIDITCSQPYLTLSLFNNTDINKIIFNKTINNKSNQYIIKHSVSQPPISGSFLPMSEKSVKTIDTDSFMLFRSLVSDCGDKNQDFYEFISNEAQKRKVFYKDRNQAKTGVYEVLFSSNYPRTEAKELFEKLFPTISRVYRKIKKGDKAQLACLLQSIEAYIVLQVITKKVAQKCPKAPLFTIHDSITTTKPFQNNIYQIMFDELTKLTGYPPKLKVEEWSPEKLDWKKHEQWI